MDGFSISWVLFYSWWLLVNACLFGAEFAFLLHFTNTPQCHRGLWISYIFINCALTFCAMYFQLPDLPCQLLHMIFLLAWAGVFLGRQWIRAVAPAAIIFTLSTFMDGISLILMGWLVNVIPGSVLGNLVHVVLTVLLAMLFCGSLYFIAKRYQFTAQQVISSYLYVLLFPCAFMVWVTRFGLGLDRGVEQLQGEMLAGRSFLWGLVCILGACGTFFVIIQIFARIISLSKQEMEGAALKDRLHEQQIYLSEAQKRSGEYRAFQHDIHNHLLVLSGMLHQRKYAEAEKYFEKLQLASGALMCRVSTGNDVLDVLLNEKIRYAEQNRISVEAAVAVPASMAIDDLDLCVVFSNLLNNAIRACLELEEKERKLQLAARVRHRFLFIEMVNPVRTAVIADPGTGLQNVRHIAEQYQGTMELQQGGGMFRVSVLLCGKASVMQPSAQPEKPLTL